MIDNLKTKQLKEELKRYRDITSCMADWIWEVNTQAQYTFVDDKVKEILGYESDDLIGNTPFDLMSKEEAARVGSLFDDITSNNAPIIELENWNLAKDGHLVCLSTSGVPIFDADGVLLGYRGVDKDITEKKQNELLLRDEVQQREQAEIALKQNEKELEKQIEKRTCELKEKVRELGFQKLAMDEHSIVSIADVNGKIIYVNQKFCEVSGFSEQELIGQNHRILSSGEHSKEFYSNLWKTISTGNVWQGILKNRKKNGRYDWSDVTITPFLNDTGKPFQYSAIRTDITERYISEMRYRELFENMSDGVAVYKAVDDGENFEFIGYNRAAEISTQVNCSDILGKNVLDVFPGIKLLGLFDVFKRVWHTGKSEKCPTKEYQDGRISLWVENYVFKLPSGEIVAIFHDLSEQKIIEQALVQSRDEAENANKSKSAFLSRMSHELRTPFNAVIGFSQLLAMQNPTEKQQSFISEIQTASHHLLELINDLLDLSRIETGHLETVIESININKVAESAINIATPFSNDKNILLQNQCDIDAKIMVDPTRIKQVFVNLITNAIKYNSKNGKVIMNCKFNDKETLRVSVSDNGLGLSEEQIDKLFTPFERLGAESKGIDGVGIGLVLSKALVEQMGGTIGVNSIPGKGSEFYVDLLYCDSKTNEEPLAEVNTSIIAPAVILYIEDNAANMRLVESLFEHEPNLRLISAVNGTQGLELATKFQPDVILLDILLPDIDGFSVLNALQNQKVTSNIPVIAVSANAMSFDIERALNVGFRKYLTKPINLKELMSALRDCIKEQ